MSKYRVWHDGIVDKARNRKKLGGYSEIHHIRPRSIGGSDEASNLIALTYREHFLVHWLLTKLHTGGELRKMQLALWAVTMNLGSRDIATWQIKVARRVIDFLEVDPCAEALWRARATEARKTTIEARFKQEMDRRRSKPKLREIDRAKVEAVLAQKTTFTRDEITRLSEAFLKSDEKPRKYRGLHPQMLKKQMASGV